MSELALSVHVPLRTAALRVSVRRGPLVAGALVALAALSLLWTLVPAFDSQGWLNWGSQVVHHGRFSTLGYPSWKPLPLLATIPLSLTGSAAPALWLVLSRAAGLAVVALGWRLASRQAGIVAGAVAAVSLLLVAHLLELTGGGLIEPVVLALVLGAVERHVSGRTGQALALATLAALGRVEVLPLVGLYALWAVLARRVRLAAAAVAVAIVPVLWLGGDWIGSGSPTHGGYLARYAGAALAATTSDHPALFVLNQALELLVTPVLVAGAAGIVLSVRRRDWVTLALAGGAFAWLFEDMVMADLGYAGERGRFLLPAAGLACVVAGVGAVRLLALVPSGRLRAAAVVVGIAASVPFAVLQVPRLVDQLDQQAQQVAVTERMDAMVHVLRRRPYFLRHRKAIYPQFLQTRLAWDLGLSNVAVQRDLPGTLVFTLPGTPTWRYYQGVCRPPLPRPPIVGGVGPWKVMHLVPKRVWAAVVAAQIRKQGGP